MGIVNDGSLNQHIGKKIIDICYGKDSVVIIVDGGGTITIWPNKESPK